MYMCAILDGTISLSSPTSALPVARILFSPLAVSGMSEVPVCRPLSDHSVSPWRIMKARGVVIVSRAAGRCDFRNMYNHKVSNSNVTAFDHFLPKVLVRYFR